MSGRFVSGTQVLPSGITSQLFPGCGQHIFPFSFHLSILEKSVIMITAIALDQAPQYQLHALQFVYSRFLLGVFFGLNPPVLRSLEDNISTAVTLSVNFLISVPPQLPRDVRSSSLGWGDPTEFSPSPPQRYFPIAHPIFIN